MKHWLIGFVLLCSACTPGSFANPVSTTKAPAGTGRIVTIDVNLTQHPDGYLPTDVTLNIGDAVNFNNSDGFNHTATLIPGATTFPTAYPFTAAALTETGSTLSSGWSSGALTAGSTSQTLIADKAGTYLYGCFYHYGHPMQATINVQ